MTALKPAKGMRLIRSEFILHGVLPNIIRSGAVSFWRGETLSAYAGTQEFRDLREAQTIYWTRSLFERLRNMLPNMLRQEGPVCRLHNQVILPATTIVSKLQGLASAYKLDMAKKSCPTADRSPETNS